MNKLYGIFHHIESDIDGYTVDHVECFGFTESEETANEYCKKYSNVHRTVCDEIEGALFWMRVPLLTVDDDITKIDKWWYDNDNRLKETSDHYKKLAQQTTSFEYGWWEEES